MATGPDAHDGAPLSRLERALAGSRDGYWERDLRRDRSWYSPSFWRLFGFEPGELPDDRNVVNARIHPDDVGTFLGRYQVAIETVGHFDYELRFLDKSGHWRWVRGRSSAWAGADGRTEFISGAVSDVHEEITARLALQAASGRFERAIDAAEEGLIERVVDDDAMYLSPRVYELLGWPPGGFPMLRSELLQRCHPDDLPGYLAASEAAMRSGERLEAHFRLRHRSGQWRWFRQRSNYDRAPDGRLRITGMLADVHEQRQAREELEQHRQQLEALVAERTARLEVALSLAEQRRQEAERAASARSQFLAHMSHEIRTPLNGVLGLAELALQSAESPQQRRWLDLAAQSGQTLLRLINDVLDYSRLEAGRLELRPQPLDLPQLMARTLRSVMPLARQDDLHVLYDWEGGPRRLMGDESRLVQILTNLLGNAAKFTERGHIALVGRAVARDDDHADVIVRVEDSGPGIAPERREQVFQAFVQGAGVTGRPQAGAGLGLAITRTLTQAMGGSLSLDDRPGGGTVFTLCLRLPLAQQPPPPPRASGLAWVLQSHPMAGAWLQRRLQRTGLDVRLTADVEALLAHARSGSAQPRLVLLSGHLPIDPPVLTRLCQALPHTQIDLVVRPDWNRAELEAHAAALGMRCWTAPLSPEDVEHMAAGASEPARPAGVARRPEVAVRVLLVEDNPVNQIIGVEFLRHLGLQVQCVADGQAAIDACLAAPPQLVLMDVQLPVLDGLQATRRLRALQAEGVLPPFPVLGLTAFAGAGDHAACLEAGMDDCLTKPLALPTLQAALQRLLPMSRAVTS